MTYQLKSFKVLQTSAMVAVLYFFLSLLIFVPIFLISLAIPDSGRSTIPFLSGGLFMLFAPFLYAVFGFIFTALGCLIYNLVAKMIGGFAFTLEEQ